MCGIAGYKINKEIDSSVLERMVEALFHRGPDSSGFFHDRMYHAGMRRLSINDVEGGDQPLYNEDRSVVLVYNGEIYNYPQLRESLEKRGHRFHSRSDGEVICHLYEEHEESLFSMLDGMFAIAVWDVKRSRLVLARDLPGEKPLYYATLPSSSDIVFASELKSIIIHPLLSSELNLQGIWDFPSFLWIPEPETVYRNIKALERGSFLVADENGVTIDKFPNNFGTDEIPGDERGLIDLTRDVVTRSIQSRLLSDVPVGSFLSGGLDSSIVAAMAVKKLPDLTTFTIGFEDVEDPYHGRADESHDASLFANRLGTTHHVVHVTADDFRRDLRTAARFGDQPFSVSSGLGIMAIARAAREKGIKVLLSGDGADECFGGYSWYPLLKYAAMPSDGAGDGDDVSCQYTKMEQTVLLSHLKSYSPQKRAWAWHYYASERDKSQLFHECVKEGRASSLRYFYKFNPRNQWECEEFIRQDREFYFPFEMLRKVDRMTMAFSVEGRVPFAAPAVLALADRLPYSIMIKDGILKWVLRQAFSDILPREIVSRPKHGFNVPVDRWLSGEWSDLVNEAFSPGSALSKHRLINIKSYEQADRMIKDKNRLSGHTIFSFVMLNLWLEECYDRINR